MIDSVFFKRKFESAVKSFLQALVVFFCFAKDDHILYFPIFSFLSLIIQKASMLLNLEFFSR